MKKLLAVVFILFAKFSFAQKPDSVAYSGIFMNWQDYKSNKLSYVMDCDLYTGKIRLNHFFSKNYIDITRDQDIRLYKDSIFGYRDCKQKDFRFFNDNDHEYKIEETGGIIIYSTEISVASSSGKSVKLVPSYFFSKTISSEIFPLTSVNLKRVFKDNQKFHDLLDMEFSPGTDISMYDDVHKKFKVNSLLEQSLIKN